MDARASAGLEQIDRAQNIAAGVPDGIGHGGTKIHLRRQVENHVRVCAGDDTGELRCLNVGAHEGETFRMPLIVLARVRKVGRVTRTEIVYSNNLVTLRKQPVDEGGADESGSTGN